MTFAIQVSSITPREKCMPSYSQSEAIVKKNSEFIPGGVVSTNRAVDPPIVFNRGVGAWLWDVSGRKYLDYHGAFGPCILGHNDPHVNESIKQVLTDGSSLFGSGTTIAEGRLAELLCHSVPCLDSIQILNSGSEATYQAIRVARAATGRAHIIKPQGGYHGWHNDVACNLMTPIDALGTRCSPGEYPFIPISAGIPEEHKSLVHVINFNDLDSAEWVCKRYPVAGLITEPILQNIGVLHPIAGYLEGLRQLADRYGFLLIFDEIKTGFRHALGGYASLSGVSPDLAVYGKAIANGYPIAVIGGKKEYMDLFTDTDPSRRVLLAGTYNAHPVPVSAAIATIERLAANQGEIFRHLERLGARMQRGLEDAYRDAAVPVVVARQGSAFCTYFMTHRPIDWHDLAQHHDFQFDTKIRRELIDSGIYVFPLAVKQWSLSAAHTEHDVDLTVQRVADALKAIAPAQ
jgi:glutamate-1-semialdehyde 2,1-aminomutase